MTTTGHTTGQASAGDLERLRAWAQGAYDCEAGVELLIRSGLLERTGAATAWPTTAGGQKITTLDTGALETALEDGTLSGGERRTALVVLSLLAGQAHAVNLADVLPGLDRGALDLVLAALAHAGGSHEYSDVRYDEHGVISGFGEGYLPPLHP